MCLLFQFPEMTVPKLCPSQSVWLAWAVGRLVASEEEPVSGVDHIVSGVSEVGHLVSEAGSVVWGVEELASAGPTDRTSGLQVKAKG